MSQAEELLSSLSENEITPLLSDPETEPHIVIGDDRVIVVPDKLKRIAVQYDHNVETVTFDCPRYWDDHDMSKMGIYINYIRKDMIKGIYRAENVVIDAEDDRIMHFDWTISRNVTQIIGGVNFLVCVKKTDDEGYEQNHWNSELNEEMYVSEGLECEDAVFEPYPDIVSQWAADIEEMKSVLLEAKESETNAKTSETNAKQSEENAAESEVAARESKELADSYWKLSKSYAVGGAAVRNDENTDNSKYYSEVAQGIYSESLTLLDECEQSLVDLNARATGVEFALNYETGNLEYTSPFYYFSVNTETGNLEWGTDV